jgi:hypothetical protein
VLAPGTIISSIICAPAAKYILFITAGFYYNLITVIVSLLFLYWGI